jgi:hypothetical protein
LSRHSPLRTKSTRRIIGQQVANKAPQKKPPPISS